MPLPAGIPSDVSRYHAAISTTAAMIARSHRRTEGHRGDAAASDGSMADSVNDSRCQFDVARTSGALAVAEQPRRTPAVPPGPHDHHDQGGAEQRLAQRARAHLSLQAQQGLVLAGMVSQRPPEQRQEESRRSEDRPGVPPW